MAVTVTFDDVEEFSDVPAGEYHIVVSDYEIRKTSEDSKHPENEYWNLELTIQDGEYENRKLWTNVMLPPYIPYDLYNILRACGWSEAELKSDEMEIDVEDDILGKEFIVRWGKQKNSDYMEVKRYKSLDDGADNNLLP